MPPLNTPVQRLKVATIPLDSHCSGPVNHSGEILTTGKFHRKKLDRFSLIIIIITHLIVNPIVVTVPSAHTPDYFSVLPVVT
jgi:hypothetical protein